MPDGLITQIAKRLVSPKKLPDTVTAVGYAEALGGNKVGKVGVRGYRQWASTSEFVRSAIDIRKGQVSAAEWDIVPFNPERPYSKRLKERIHQLFDTPNPIDETFNTMIERVAEDILTIDAGAIEVERSTDRQIRQLWATDGGEIKVSKVWDGDPLEPRYFWWPMNDLRERARLLNEDLIYLMQRPRTYSVIGLGNLEVLRLAIEAELFGSEYNARMVSSAGGEGIFDLGENARADQVEKFQRYWEAEVAGRAATAFWGGTRGAKWIPFRSNNKDMQFLEWQEYLVKKIAAVFEMHAQDLQIAHEVNKATSEVLDDQTQERGAKRLLKLIQAELTRQIVWDGAFGGRDNNLAFRFTRLNLKQSLNQANIDKIYIESGERAINELRKEKGLEPYESDVFDWPIAMSPVGAVSLKDIPTARELMDAKNKAAPVGAAAEGEA